MELKPEVREALIKIDFVERAKKLTENYSSNREGRFRNYDNNEITKLFNQIGYKVKYDKRENFFAIIKKEEDTKYKFHICLKYGFVEMGWYIMKNNKYYNGNVWSMMKYLLDGIDEVLVLPQFNNYEELEEILKIACQMFEEFKDELCNVN